MKKKYVKPAEAIMAIEPSTFICRSGVTSPLGIDYGGVDEDGDMTPSSREFDPDDEEW